MYANSEEKCDVFGKNRCCFHIVQIIYYFDNRTATMFLFNRWKQNNAEDKVSMDDVTKMGCRNSVSTITNEKSNKRNEDPKLGQDTNYSRRKSGILEGLKEHFYYVRKYDRNTNGFMKPRDTRNRFKSDSRYMGFGGCGAGAAQLDEVAGDFRNRVFLLNSLHDL